jgi:hypothetical protein
MMATDDIGYLAEMAANPADALAKLIESRRLVRGADS